MIFFSSEYDSLVRRNKKLRLKIFKNILFGDNCVVNFSSMRSKLGGALSRHDSLKYFYVDPKKINRKLWEGGLNTGKRDKVEFYKVDKRFWQALLGQNWRSTFRPKPFSDDLKLNPQCRPKPFSENIELNFLVDLLNFDLNNSTLEYQQQTNTVKPTLARADKNTQWSTHLQNLFLQFYVITCFQTSEPSPISNYCRHMTVYV